MSNQPQNGSQLYLYAVRLAMGALIGWAYWASGTLVEIKTAMSALVVKIGYVEAKVADTIIQVKENTNTIKRSHP